MSISPVGFSPLLPGAGAAGATSNVTAGTAGLDPAATLAGIDPTGAPAGTDPAGASETVTGPGFAAVLAHGVDQLQGLQSTADGLAVAAATGDLTDVHDYMIAATQAQLATELTVAVRNKAIEAFNEIMRMPI